MEYREREKRCRRKNPIIPHRSLNKNDGAAGICTPILRSDWTFFTIGTMSCCMEASHLSDGVGRLESMLFVQYRRSSSKQAQKTSATETVRSHVLCTQTGLVCRRR